MYLCSAQLIFSEIDCFNGISAPPPNYPASYGPALPLQATFLGTKHLYILIHCCLVKSLLKEFTECEADDEELSSDDEELPSDNEQIPDRLQHSKKNLE